MVVIVIRGGPIIQLFRTCNIYLVSEEIWYLERCGQRGEIFFSKYPDSTTDTITVSSFLGPSPAWPELGSTEPRKVFQYPKASRAEIYLISFYCDVFHSKLSVLSLLNHEAGIVYCCVSRADSLWKCDLWSGREVKLEMDTCLQGKSSYRTSFYHIPDFCLSAVKKMKSQTVKC